MIETYTLVECTVEFLDGSTKILSPTIYEISVWASSSHDKQLSAINFLRDGNKNINKITVNDVYYFQTKEDYLKYLKSIE
jgi:hypothetical protein